MWRRPVPVELSEIKLRANAAGELVIVAPLGEAATKPLPPLAPLAPLPPLPPLGHSTLQAQLVLACGPRDSAYSV